MTASIQPLNNIPNFSRINTLNQIRINEQKIATNNKKIAVIDEKIASKEKLIAANEKFLKDTKELMDVTKELIDSNEALIVNNNERIGLLSESKELLVSSIENTKQSRDLSKSIITNTEKMIKIIETLVDLVKAGKVNLYKDQNGDWCAKELKSQQTHVKIVPKLDLYEIGTLNALNGFEGKVNPAQLANVPQAYLSNMTNINVNTAAPVHLPIMASNNAEPSAHTSSVANNVSNQEQITNQQKRIDRNIEFTKPIITSKLQEYSLLNLNEVKLKVSELISSKYANVDLSKNLTRLNLFKIKLDDILSMLSK